MTLFIRYSVKTLPFMCAFLFSGLALAGPGHWEHKVEKMTQKLDLSKSQQTQIQAIIDNGQPQRRVLRGEIKQLRKQVTQFIEAENQDKEQLQKLNFAIAEKKTDLMILRSNAKKLIQEQLTAEQANKLQTIRAKHKERRQTPNKRHNDH